MLILNNVIIIFTVIITLVKSQRESYCPPQEVILPCRCSQKGEEIQIWCSHSDLPRVLSGIKSVSKTINRPIDELILENNFLPSLPGRSFSSLRILRLMLRHNALERLSNGWLNDLEDSLVEVFIVERDLRSVPVDSLNGLRKLEAVTIQSEALKRSPDFSGLSRMRYVNIQSPSLLELTPMGFRDMNNLETVQITGSPRLSRLEAGLFHDLPKISHLNVAENGINWIHLRALSGLPNLKSLILTDNKISDAGMVGRAIKDIGHLEILKLDRNHINVLGEGSFVDLPSLKELYLNGNSITEIHHGAFHRTPNLKIVHLENNFLRRVHPESFLQASGSGVEILHLQRNEISRIEELRSLLDALPSLKFLDLSLNKLEEIPFGALRGHGTLEQLYLDNNLIRMIERDAFMAMPGLRELRLKNNSISDLLAVPFWNLPGLKGLDLSYNQIRRIDPPLLMGLPSLRRIDMSGNSLVSLDPTSFANTPMLETINISSNEISLIHPATFRNLEGLFEIDASRNLLQEMIPGLPRAVERIILQKNRINTLPFAPSKNLDLPNLRMLDISSNMIQRIPRSSFKSLEQLRVLSLAKNKVQTIDEGSLIGLNRLEFLNFQDNKIMALHERSLNSLNQLRDLNMQGNRLELLSDRLLDNLPQLERLDVSRNNIVEISPNSFRQARSIQILDLSTNNLKELPESLSGLSELKEIDVSFNQIGNLSPNVLGAWRKLEELRASNNKISELRQGLFRNLPLLQYLDLSSNELGLVEHGAIRNLQELQELVLADNKLVDIQDRVFEDLPNLQAVHLQQNFLRTISPNSFYRSPSIVYLNLSSNHFNTMDHVGLRSVRNLEVLDLSNNGIRRISTNPLRGLDWLVELKLDDNRICKIQGEPFSTMPRLRVLSLRNNRMVSLPEVSFRSLRGNIAVLDIDGNPLDCSCDMLWLRAWLEAEANNPGPRCRDGTMLREARITRHDCQFDSRNNQLPLTNDHGDFFVRRNDFDECENDSVEDLQNQLPPSPQESEYFYDQFVDYPINDTHLAISNSSTPINLLPPQRPLGYDPNNTLLHFNQHNLNLQNQRPSSQFTFFGVPLPSLGLGKLWGGGRDANNRAVSGSRGKGRVQIYRPDDPELMKFFHSPGRIPEIENRNRNTNLNYGEIETAEKVISQDNNDLYHRPYFQTPFLEPNVEKGGFVPMLPGSGGFKPINDPTNITTSKRESSSFSSSSPNGINFTENKKWPEEFNEKVSFVTEPAKKTEITTPYNVESETSLQQQFPTESKPIEEEKSGQNSNRLDSITNRPSVYPTSEEPIEQAINYNNEKPFQDTMIPSDEVEVLTTSSPNNQHQTANTFTASIPTTSESPFSSDFSSEPTIEDFSKQIKPPDIWENINHSPSSLSALVAPGAQQNVNVYRTPPGRSTITKVISPPPILPTAEEYLRPSSHQNRDNDAESNEVVTTTIIDEVEPKKSEDMIWYFANYNKTNDNIDFDPGLNRLRSNSSRLIGISQAFLLLLVIFNVRF